MCQKFARLRYGTWTLRAGKVMENNLVNFPHLWQLICPLPNYQTFTLLARGLGILA